MTGIFNTTGQKLVSFHKIQVGVLFFVMYFHTLLTANKNSTKIILLFVEYYKIILIICNISCAYYWI